MPGFCSTAAGSVGTKVQSSQASDVAKPKMVDHDKAPTCITCVAGFMGAECEAREVAAIQEFQRGWLGWDEQVQAAEVIKIGLLSLHHAHPGSMRVANVLLPYAQQSELLLVRTAAIIAFGIRQEPSIAVPVLIEAYVNAEAKARSLEPRIKKLGRKMDKDNRKVIRAKVDPKARKLSEKEQQRIKRDRDMYYALQEQRVGLLSDALVSLPSMGSYKDDRCTKLLLKGSIGWEPKIGLGKALLRNGSAPCVARAIRGLKFWEKKFKEHDKEIEKLTNQRVPPAPADWRDAREAWKRHFKVSQEKRLKRPRRERDACIEEMRTLYESLELMCTKQGLPPAKLSLHKFASNWQQWLKTHRGSLPQKHPVIAAPVKKN